MPAAGRDRSAATRQDGVQQPSICRIRLQKDPCSQGCHLRDRAAARPLRPVEAGAQCQLLTCSRHCEESLQQSSTVLRPAVHIVGDQQKRPLMVDQQAPQFRESLAKVEILGAGQRRHRPDAAAHHPDARVDRAHGQHRQSGAHPAAPRPGDQ